MPENSCNGKMSGVHTPRSHSHGGCATALVRDPQDTMAAVASRLTTDQSCVLMVPDA